MHSPESVAFGIRLGKKEKRNGEYRLPLITIWHKDPCSDGTDDSCGYMIRPRHCNQEVLSKIKKEFDFNFENNYWFDEDGNQIFSTIGTLMQMYRAAAWIHFDHNRKKVNRFMVKHTPKIIWFAENPVDCIGNAITNKWGYDKDDPERFGGLAGIIYSDILMAERKWYQHPKWHIRHWRIQFHPWQQFKRRYFLKCSICGKRGFKSSPMSDWNGTKYWHQDCDAVNHKKQKVKSAS